MHPDMYYPKYIAGRQTYLDSGFSLVTLKRSWISLQIYYLDGQKSIDLLASMLSPLQHYTKIRFQMQQT